MSQRVWTLLAVSVLLTATTLGYVNCGKSNSGGSQSQASREGERRTSPTPEPTASSPTPSPPPYFSPPPSAIAKFRTYLGGNTDEFGRDVVSDSSGAIYVTGGTNSSNFPTTAGAFDRSINGQMDVFVSKFNADGTLAFSTFLGGPNYDRAYAIELCGGDIFLAGRAGEGFPTTPGTVQPNFGGDVAPVTLYGKQDGFVARLSGDGKTLKWATYFGGDDYSIIRDLVLDSKCNIWLGMASLTRTTPHITSTAYQKTKKANTEGGLFKISSDGKTLLYGTYLGGSGDDGGTPSIRVDSQDNVFYLMGTTSSDLPASASAFQRSLGGGSDLFLAKFSTAGQFLWGTYFGGTKNEGLETHNLEVTSNGEPVIGANTQSSNLPVSPGAFQKQFAGGAITGNPSSGDKTNYMGDGIVAKFSSDGSKLLAATYLGGSYGEGIQGVAIMDDGQILVSGASFSQDFPRLSGAYGGKGDGFIVGFDPNLTQTTFSKQYGGSGFDQLRSLTLSIGGSVISVGHSLSANFPVTSNAYQKTTFGGEEVILIRELPLEP